MSRTCYPDETTLFTLFSWYGLNIDVFEKSYLWIYQGQKETLYMYNNAGLTTSNGNSFFPIQCSNIMRSE